MSHKEKKNKEKNLFEILASQTKGEILSRTVAAKYFVNTGNLAFNYICSGKFIGGGIPGGRITELYGPSASAKSLWATNVLFGAQQIDGVAILLDCENASNPEWIKKASRLDIDKVIRYTPKTLEQAFSKMYNVIRLVREHDKEIPIVIVYDSISSSPSEREYREIDLPEEYTEAEFKRIVQKHEQPGERAKACSKEFRKLNGLLEDVDATILMINQTRSSIGVLYGSPEVKAGGGNAMEFYTSLSFRTSASKVIKDNRLNTTIGVNVKLSNKKNRFFRPFATADKIHLYFDTGINPVSGLLEVLKQAERIEAKSQGNYKVSPNFLPQGLDEYVFKSSVERGDVPIKLLLDCPKIVDAESSAQVEEYLAPYADFTSLESEIVEEQIGDGDSD